MAYMDMRLPTLSKWQPTDSRPVRTGEEYRWEINALHEALKSLKAMQNGGRMLAKSIRAALKTNDRALPDYLRQLVRQGHLKRELLGGRYVYSLSKPSVNAREVARAKAKRALIAKFKREIRKKETALRNLGC